MRMGLSMFYRFSSLLLEDGILFIGIKNNILFNLWYFFVGYIVFVITKNNNIKFL